MIDKDAWGPGPWQEEPDREEWRHEPTRLPCMIIRDPESGVLCGYVGVPPIHPLHGRSGTDKGLEAHCGVTYSNKSIGEIRVTSATDGAGDLWWFGFDCGHADDLQPSSRMDDLLLFSLLREQARIPRAMKTYRDIHYVRRQVNHLAAQLGGFRHAHARDGRQRGHLQ